MTENHEEYDNALKYWKKIRTFVKGKDEVQLYLQDVVTEADHEAMSRNINYKQRAKYINFPQRTLNALVGAVFSKEATMELPIKLEYITLNANGAGKSLEQIAKVCVSNIVQVGRHGLLASYNVSKGQAKLTTYTAENILNWSEDEDGNLNSVKLRINDELFKYLIMRDGVYTIEMRDENDELVEEIVTPTKSDGTTFDYIPFSIIGSKDNSPDVDEEPLYPIVDITQGHYQNSADYEDMLRILQPTPWANNIDKQYMEDMYPAGFIPFGTGAMIVLPEGSQAGLIQPAENQMISQAMEHKEELLVMLGARLIQSGGQAETAEAVRIKYSAESSILINLVGNVSRAIEQRLEDCAMFMGANPDEVIYQLNREFFDTNLSPQEVSAQILLLDRGVKAMSDVRHTLRQADDIQSDRTDEMIDEDVQNSGGGLI